MLICMFLVFLLYCRMVFVFVFKQKTAYDMRISDWSSDVCSSDLSGSRSWPFSGNGLRLKSSHIGIFETFRARFHEFGRRVSLLSGGSWHDPDDSDRKRVV